MANNALQENLSKRFRKLLTNDPNGVPPWLAVVAAGDDAGYFLPTDAPWVVHADFGTLVGGIRALLMQALHPGSLTGVANHSRYEKDPLGRLSGTIRWLTVTTFGSKTAVANEAQRVNRMHTKVTGDYQKTNGETISYRASDPDLLLWVHIAFSDSFLKSHQAFSFREIPRGAESSGADNYVKQWSISVAPLGLSTVPMSEIELNAEIDRFYTQGILGTSEKTKEVVRFIQFPPLPRSARLVYRLLFNAAVSTLEPRFVEMLGLKPSRSKLTRPATKFLLRFMRFAIGPESPIEDAAVARIKRVTA